MDYTAYFTQDMARRIYNSLLEKDSGQLPFPEFKLHYSIRERAENNEPLEVVLEIFDEDNNKEASYTLKYDGSYSAYRFIRGNEIVKR